MASNNLIHSNGYWCDEKVPPAKFDVSLCDEISKFVSGTVMDLGCGDGNFVKNLRNSNIQAFGVDGNPNTPSFGDFLSSVDLSKPTDFKQSFDWVLCLEVGEHIPEEFEKQVFENITQNALVGVIVSWAIPGQIGRGHVNLRPHDYVKNELVQRGFELNEKRTQDLRRAASVWWYKQNVMLFDRVSPACPINF